MGNTSDINSFNRGTLYNVPICSGLDCRAGRREGGRERTGG